MGTYPSQKKLFAICPIAPEAKVLAAFEAENPEVKAGRGHRYVGGYVGSLEMRNRWIEPMVEAWVVAVKILQ